MKDKQNGHKTETPDVSHIRNVEVTHEKSDVSVRGVLTFVVVLYDRDGRCIGAWRFVQLLRRAGSQRTQTRSNGYNRERLPPEPRLQSAPGFEITFEDGQKKVSKGRSHKLSMTSFANSGTRTSGLD